jgi:hypothetical protein
MFRSQRTLGLVLAILILFSAGCSQKHNDVTGEIETPVESDHVAPAAVTDLHVTLIEEYAVVLAWTAPRDSGTSCVEYKLRMSQSPISPANFDSTSHVESLSHPLPADSAESFRVADLETGTRYYFALKTRDENENWSELSNVTMVTLKLDSAVAFADTALERVVRAAVSRPEGVLRRSHVAGLRNLSADNAGIVKLEGIEHCRSLQHLSLVANKIVNLQPLLEIATLKRLYLTDNLIDSLPDLSSLANLEHLLLSGNRLHRIKPVSDCKRLTILRAENMQLADWDTLALLIAIEELSISGNQVPNLNFTRGMRQLRYLSCVGNLVTDLRPLVDNPGIDTGDEIWLMNNPLSEEARNVQAPQLTARGVKVHL